MPIIEGNRSIVACGNRTMMKRRLADFPRSLCGHAITRERRRRNRITGNGVPVLVVLTLFCFVVVVAKNTHHTVQDGLSRGGRGERLRIPRQLKDEDHDDDEDRFSLPYHDERVVRQRKKDQETADFVAMTKLKQQQNKNDKENEVRQDTNTDKGNKEKERTTTKKEEKVVQKETAKDDEQTATAQPLAVRTPTPTARRTDNPALPLYFYTGRPTLAPTRRLTPAPTDDVVVVPRTTSPPTVIAATPRPSPPPIPLAIVVPVTPTPTEAPQTPPPTPTPTTEETTTERPEVMTMTAVPIKRTAAPTPEPSPEPSARPTPAPTRAPVPRPMTKQPTTTAVINRPVVILQSNQQNKKKDDDDDDHNDEEEEKEEEGAYAPLRSDISLSSFVVDLPELVLDMTVHNFTTMEEATASSSSTTTNTALEAYFVQFIGSLLEVSSTATTPTTTKNDLYTNQNQYRYRLQSVTEMTVEVLPNVYIEREGLLVPMAGPSSLFSLSSGAVVSLIRVTVKGTVHVVIERPPTRNNEETNSAVLEQVKRRSRSSTLDEYRTIPHDETRIASSQLKELLRYSMHLYLSFWGTEGIESAVGGGGSDPDPEASDTDDDDVNDATRIFWNPVIISIQIAGVEVVTAASPTRSETGETEAAGDSGSTNNSIAPTSYESWSSSSSSTQAFSFPMPFLLTCTYLILMHCNL